MNKLDITSKEISSLAEMDLLFEGYCKENRFHLDFTKGPCCNGYLDERTSDAFCWFINGVLHAIGDDHLRTPL